MKKASKTLVDLTETNSTHVIDAKNNFTVIDYVKQRANADYGSPEENLKYFRHYMKQMNFISQSDLRGVSLEEVMEYFKTNDNQ